MGPSSILAGVGVALAAALYFALSWGMGQHDAALKADYALELTNAKAALKEEYRLELKDITDDVSKQIRVLESDHNKKEQEYVRELRTAREDAAQKPIAFGDDVQRDFIRIDCLWAAGERATDPGVRSACSDEAANADPTRQGVSFVALTPSFLAGWRDACEDWPRVGTGEGDLAYSLVDWTEEYGNFDAGLCRETLVAMTPDMSVFLRRFVNNGADYTLRILQHSQEQERIIDTITDPKKATPQTQE